MTDFGKILTPTEEELAQGHRNWIQWLKESPNNFSHWFPKLQNILQTPKSIVVKVPDELIECYFMEKPGDSDRVYQFVEETIRPAILENFPNADKVFMKNGCFSNKFNFSKACLVEDFSVANLVRHLLEIEGWALAYDTSGDLEIVIREYIPTPEGTPAIYNGMPLRPEMRVFYDFDRKTILYDKFYWDWDYLWPNLEDSEDAETFQETYPVIESDYLTHRGRVLEILDKQLREVQGMEGCWSIDILIDGSTYWCIDAAIASQSAYWDPDRAQSVLIQKGFLKPEQ